MWPLTGCHPSPLLCLWHQHCTMPCTVGAGYGVGCSDWHWRLLIDAKEDTEEREDHQEHWSVVASDGAIQPGTWPPTHVLSFKYWAPNTHHTQHDDISDNNNSPVKHFTINWVEVYSNRQKYLFVGWWIALNLSRVFYAMNVTTLKINSIALLESILQKYFSPGHEWITNSYNILCWTWHLLLSMYLDLDRWSSKYSIIIISNIRIENHSNDVYLIKTCCNVTLTILMSLWRPLTLNGIKQW